MWVYADLVLVPYQRAEAAASGRPRGNLSDLYPRWLGARELLLRGRNPYSSEVTQEIQEGYYGRALEATRPNEPKDKQGFAYPVYVVFLLAPTVKLPFQIVQTGFRWFLFLLLGLSVGLWFRALRWRPSCFDLATVTVLVIGSFPAVQGIKLQQLTLVVCALLAGCAAALATERFILAGILLGIATVKPQLAIPVAGWIGLWTISGWKVRQRVMWSFLLTVGGLVCGGELLLPGWIGQFRRAAEAYMNYAGGNSLLDFALPAGMGKPAAGLVVLLVAIFCWRTRKAGADSDEFRWSMAVVLTATLVIIPTFAPYNQLLLIPAILMIVRSSERLRAAGQLPKLAVVLTAAVIFAPWVAAVILDTLLLFMNQVKVEKAWAVPLWTSWATPFPVLAAVALGGLLMLKTGPSSEASVRTSSR